jgi:hypothetical protein
LVKTNGVSNASYSPNATARNEEFARCLGKQMGLAALLARETSGKPGSNTMQANHIDCFDRTT